MFDEIFQKMRTFFGSYLEKMRVQLLGRNNERLDFLVDSFYKLKDQQRTYLVAGFSAVIGVVVLFTTIFYFYKTNELDENLNQKLIALREFRTEGIGYKIGNKRYEHLIKIVDNKISNLRLKSFFEKTMKEKKIEYRDLNTVPVESDGTDPIFERIKEYNVEIRISKISIPKIIDFIIKVEKSSYLIKIRDFKVTGLYGNKLFFDLDVVFRAFQNI